MQIQSGILLLKKKCKISERSTLRSVDFSLHEESNVECKSKVRFNSPDKSTLSTLSDVLQILTLAKVNLLYTQKLKQLNSTPYILLIYIRVFWPISNAINHLNRINLSSLQESEYFTPIVLQKSFVLFLCVTRDKRLTITVIERKDKKTEGRSIKRWAKKWATKRR